MFEFKDSPVTKLHFLKAVGGGSGGKVSLVSYKL